MPAEQRQTLFFLDHVPMLANATFRDVSREPARSRLTMWVRSFHRLLWPVNGIGASQYAQ